MISRLITLLWGGLAIYSFYYGDNAFGIGFMALAYFEQIEEHLRERGLK